MAKMTHLPRLAAQELRLGGVPVSLKGAQAIAQVKVPSTWYPVNLPSASNATPLASDCQRLLNTLAPLVADLTIRSSVVLSSAYRTVQTGVVAGGTFTAGGVTSATANSWFDSAIRIGEAVAVDVVNKNPALGYDLAVRLASQAAGYIDKLMLALYAQFTTAAIGTASTVPSAANLATAVADLPVTGEPALIVMLSATRAAMVLAGLSAQADVTDRSILIGGSTTGTPVRPYRVFASDNVAASSGNRNLALLPSAYAYVSADMATSFGASGQPGFITGTVFQEASVAVDPERATNQLAMQLVIGNTGSGNQTVYVNVLGAPIVLAPLSGIQILS